MTILWTVTTSNINTDWTYLLNAESIISDIEYRDCMYLQQPQLNTFPKVWDTVLLMIVWWTEYVVLWVIAENVTKYLSIGNDVIKIWEVTWEIKIQTTDIQLLGTTITANWENLIIDNI